jgi:cell division protein FtsB
MRCDGGGPRRLDTKADLISGDLTAVKTDMAELRRQVSGHARTLDVLSQDVRTIRAAANVIAKVDVTSGEVEAMHRDLNRLRQEVSELTARVALMEERDRH